MKILVWIRAIRVLLAGLPRAASFTPEELADHESASIDCSSTQEAEFCTLCLSMRFKIEFRPKALRDIKRLSPPVSRRIEQKIELLAEDLTGDVKRLVKYIPG